MQKLGQENAFPLDVNSSKMIANGYDAKQFKTGMSKRFYAACAAMQGLAANPVGFVQADEKPHTVESFIANAYILADELLKQENQ